MTVLKFTNIPQNPGAPSANAVNTAQTTNHSGAQGPDSRTRVGSDTGARIAALNTRSSCIVEAPAGSGKTALLIQRFLKLLAEPSVEQPEEVLAITFTNQATSELRERILHQLQAAQANTPLDPSAKPFEHETRALAATALAHDAQLNWQILTRPQRLNIRTMHSLCGEIAGAVPLLAGGATRNPTDDPGPLYRLAAQRTLRELGGPDRDLHEALRTVLLHRDANLNDVESLLADMLQQREQWAELVPLGPNALDHQILDSEVREKLQRTLEFIVCSGLTRALEVFPTPALHDATALAAHLGAIPPFKDYAPLLAICANKLIPPEDRAEHLDHWLALAHMLLTRDGWRKSINRNYIGHDFDAKRDKPLLEQLIADLRDAPNSDEILQALLDLRTLPPTRYPDDQWHVVKALFHVLRRALAELNVLFAERSECDFAELELAALQALRSEDSATDIALATGSRLRHLLVDEVQDTSAAQYDLIHLLTQSWDGANQTLFLVGDPKQSIYLFRQARVERFLRTMREARLADIPLTPLRLTTNFRSQAELVHAFNDTFERLFPSLEEAAQTRNTIDVPFVAAVPDRDATDTTAMNWHAALMRPRDELKPRDNPRREHEQRQAREIRAAIQYWLAQPLPPGRTKPWSLAILARNRAHLAPIVAELKRAQIPFRAIKIDQLNELPEVLDSLALTRALLHPSDRAAWLAVLHAPWCGLNRADLLALTTGDTNTPIPHLVASRSNLLSEEGQQLLARAWPTLQTSLDTLGATPLDVHVERTWRSLGGDAPLTPTQQTNVLRYLEVLREVSAETGHADLPTLTARLENLYAEPAAGDIQLDLSTIHGAKGLEWDVVLVPGLERRGANTSSGLLNWLKIDNAPADASPVILAPIWRKGDDTDPLNKWLNSARSTREDAERKRLFYVLATRAKEELHLFAACETKSDGTLALPKYGSLLKSIWPAAEEHFTPTFNSHLDSQLQQSVDEEDFYAEDLAFAASAAEAPTFPVAQIERLPLTFNPLDRFIATSRLPYLPATTLQQAPIFDRPEGSFAVRAFGNVVHRYLQLLSTRLETISPADLLAELPQWEPRLLASLRGEGISPQLAARESQRALHALASALSDPIGLWILSPHTLAASEQAITSPELRSLRADRTFLAGATPLSPGDTHIWIVDFKTAAQGSRSDSDFHASELAKYQPQLEAYANVRSQLPDGNLPIRLGLYYPLVPRLLSWESSPKSTTGSSTAAR
jgi:ATP-dependent exoDNAse (exonuclease V) beta subunit